MQVILDYGIVLWLQETIAAVSGTVDLTVFKNFCLNSCLYKINFSNES